MYGQIVSHANSTLSNDVGNKVPLRLLGKAATLVISVANEAVYMRLRFYRLRQSSQQNCQIKSCL